MAYIEREYERKELKKGARWKEISSNEAWKKLSVEYGYASYSSMLGMLFNAMERGSVINTETHIYRKRGGK